MPATFIDTLVSEEEQRTVFNPGEHGETITIGRSPQSFISIKGLTNPYYAKVSRTHFLVTYNEIRNSFILLCRGRNGFSIKNGLETKNYGPEESVELRNGDNIYFARHFPAYGPLIFTQEGEGSTVRDINETQLVE